MKKVTCTLGVLILLLSGCSTTERIVLDGNGHPKPKCNRYVYVRAGHNLYDKKWYYEDNLGKHCNDCVKP